MVTVLYHQPLPSFGWKVVMIQNCHLDPETLSIPQPPMIIVHHWGIISWAVGTSVSKWCAVWYDTEHSQPLGKTFTNIRKHEKRGGEGERNSIHFPLTPTIISFPRAGWTHLILKLQLPVMDYIGVTPSHNGKFENLITGTLHILFPHLNADADINSLYLGIGNF